MRNFVQNAALDLETFHVHICLETNQLCVNNRLHLSFRVFLMFIVPPDQEVCPLSLCLCKGHSRVCSYLCVHRVELPALSMYVCHILECCHGDKQALTLAPKAGHLGGFKINICLP